MKMPFGKYKDRDISDIPTDYLEWLLNNIIIWEPLKTAIQDIINNQQPIKRSEVQKIYRQLAKKYHPDIGGDNLAMSAINNFYELLIKK